jgi:hypothetical protein
MPSKRRSSPLLVLLFLAVSSTATSQPLQYDDQDDLLQAPIVGTAKDQDVPVRYVRLDDVTESLDEVKEVIVPAYVPGSEVQSLSGQQVGNTKEEEPTEGWGWQEVKAVVEERTRGLGERLADMWTELAGR